MICHRNLSVFILRGVLLKCMPKLYVKTTTNYLHHRCTLFSGTKKYTRTPKPERRISALVILHVSLNRLYRPDKYTCISEPSISTLVILHVSLNRLYCPDEYTCISEPSITTLAILHVSLNRLYRQ